jgi:hypothetical protein
MVTKSKSKSPKNSKIGYSMIYIPMCEYESNVFSEKCDDACDIKKSVKKNMKEDNMKEMKNKELVVNVSNPIKIKSTAKAAKKASNSTMKTKAVNAKMTKKAPAAKTAAKTAIKASVKTPMKRLGQTKGKIVKSTGK